MITAISPIDGRYARTTNRLTQFFSEDALIHHRAEVEIDWIIALADAGIGGGVPLSPELRGYLMSLIGDWTSGDAERVKELEQTTNHDVKALEYWLGERFQKESQLMSYIPYIHFACTSEDINNIAYSLMCQRSRDTILLPTFDTLIEILTDFAHRYADRAMMARTHGQGATPTTLGKEFANVVSRLSRERDKLRDLRFTAKMNGATGNYSAHTIAYPDVDWIQLTDAFIGRYGLEPHNYTTQIEPHDTLAEYCQIQMRIDTILIDFSRDIWGYISLGYLIQKPKDGEIGSSTMPHKINPIDFENAEGNLGIANALLDHFATKLPISRFQRDLSDSTVLRNLGVPFSHILIAYESLKRGLGKLDIGATAMDRDLDENWALLAEPIQTVMRRYGIGDSYEKLKDLTRGKVIMKDDIHAFIQSLDIPADARARLLDLTPKNYLGIARELAERIGKKG